MSDTSVAVHTWVAIGPAGTIGWITGGEGRYTFKLVNDAQERAVYPNLEVAKSALHASLVPGTDWPEFREH